MPNISFRILQPVDKEIYRNLRLFSYQESPFAFSKSYEDESQQPLTKFAEELQVIGKPPERFILGVFESDKLIGFAKFKRDTRYKARHKAMIHAMYVSPEHRNDRLGKQIIDQIIERAKALEGLEQIHLWVLHARSSAVGFYKKCGFESQGYVKQDLKLGDTYIDAEYMVRYLK